MARKRTQTSGVLVLLAGVGAVLTLATADTATSDRRVPLWAWLLAWAVVAVGVYLLAAPLVQDWWAARSQRLAAEAEARAAYALPTADIPVYNEGRWWLVVNRGSDSSTIVKCQVFDPLGRDPSRGFSEMGSGPVTLCYPNDFGIGRPLPSGEHTVVWSLGTRGGGVEEARTSFRVNDDIGALAGLVGDLVAFRTTGRDLLNEAPPGDFEDWNARVGRLYQELKRYFENSVHLGKPEAMRLAFFHAEFPPLQTAQVELSHFLERIDELVAQFGGDTE